jgi:multiple sugar transport system permease protein
MTSLERYQASLRQANVGQNKKKKYSKAFLHEEKHALLFVLVPIIGFLLFTFASTCFSIYQSLTNFNPLKVTYAWVGLDNYINLFQDKRFINSCINTVVLLVSIPIGITIGFLIAAFIRKMARGSKILSLLFYLPAVTSAVAICVVWQYMYNYEYGIINLIFGFNIDWYSNTDFFLVKIAIMIKGVWGGIGSTLILFLAGLNNIPKEYYEASEIDGANRLQQMVHVTVPMVSPTVFYLLVTQVISHLQAYADAKILTKGARQAQTIIYYIWTYGIEDSRYGLASAAAVTLAIVIVIVTIIQFKRSKLLEV